MSTSYLPNNSFVLKAVENVVYEDRAVPESKSIPVAPLIYSNFYPVQPDEVLVEVKKTGKFV